MLKHRVIPVLLLRGAGLVKTVKFKDPKYVGDPVNAIRIFNQKEVDELMVLDIEASKLQREPNFNLIHEMASECFMPLAYGGGIRTIEQAEKIFSCGVEKICIQSSAFQNPDFITSLANRFGSQSIVVSVDIKRNWLGHPKVYLSTKSKLISDDWRDWISRLMSAGAGELLLNAVDRDGTLSGPDTDLIADASRLINVPLVAIGGIGSQGDIKNAIVAGADAVAAGSFFVYHGPHRAVLITYPKQAELKLLLADISR